MCHLHHVCIQGIAQKATLQGSFVRPGTQRPIPCVAALYVQQSLCCKLAFWIVPGPPVVHIPQFWGHGLPLSKHGRNIVTKSPSFGLPLAALRERWAAGCGKTADKRLARIKSHPYSHTCKHSLPAHPKTNRQVWPWPPAALLKQTADS